MAKLENFADALLIEGRTFNGTQQGQFRSRIASPSKSEFDSLKNEFDSLKLGSHPQVNTIVDRDAIPSSMRLEGMLCPVKETGLIYKLEGGITNANWSDISKMRHYVLGPPDGTTWSGTPTIASYSSIRLDPNVRAIQDGIISSCSFYGEIAGSATIVTLGRVKTKYNVKRTQAITVPGAGLFTLPLALDVDEGDVIGIHQDVGCLRQRSAFYSGWTGNQLYTMTSVSVPSGTFEPSGPVAVSMHLNFKLDYNS